MNRKKKISLIILAVILVGAVVGGWLYVDSLAYKVCRVEAGVEVIPSDFLKTPDEEAYFTEESEAFSITKPGEYQIKVKSGWFTHTSTLYIEDTIQPKGQAQDIRLELGETCTAGDFVVDVEDVTDVKISFAHEPDFAKPGSQTVKLLLSDLGNNALMLQAELFISQVEEELIWEAGEAAPAVTDFLIEAKEAAFVTDVSAIDMSRIADHEIVILADGNEYQSLLHVVDTTAPDAQLQEVSDFALVPKVPEDFVVAIEDVTEVSVTFIQEPDLSVVGTQVVELLLTDEAGNETVKQTSLHLEADTEAPVLTGVKDILIYVGDAIAYRKGVEVTDNCPEGLTFEIDNSQVKLAEAGEYPVTYSATDLAGNVTEQVITVTIKPRSHTQEEIDALADAVLAKIIKPEMTQLEIVRAIYDYNMSHIRYINHSDKGDWIQAAYEGLAEGKGDCYVYACTAKQLLTRAGITNMDIAKIPARTSHYWNLVDIGDGWYHFDTTPRKDHPTIFMWTDEEMMAYSAKHGKSHNYDPALYPEIN